MKLVVGLGNPGAEYRDTRHNVGFMVVDELAHRWGLDHQWRDAFESLTVRGTVGPDSVWLMKPLTYMNLSGRAVAGLAGYFKVPPADILVVTDDVALPVGRLRARRSGSSGGHNGLRSLSAELGTDDYPRVRVGVGRGEIVGADGQVIARPDMVQHVLGRFRPDERATIEAAVRRAADASALFVAEGIGRVMDAFNAADSARASRPAADVESGQKGS